MAIIFTTLISEGLFGPGVLGRVERRLRRQDAHA